MYSHPFNRPHKPPLNVLSDFIFHFIWLFSLMVLALPHLSSNHLISLIHCCYSYDIQFKIIFISHVNDKITSAINTHFDQFSLNFFLLDQKHQGLMVECLHKYIYRLYYLLIPQIPFKLLLNINPVGIFIYLSI